jgi:Flp pilus assembly protein TadD
VPLLPIALIALAAASKQPSRALDSAEARQQVRACLSSEAEASARAAACQRAAELGLNREWSASIRVVLAQQLIELMRWDEAVAVYRGLAAEMPREAEWPVRMAGTLLFGAGRPAAAEAAAREALLRAPGSAEAWSLLGVSLNAEGRHAEAVAALEKARLLDADFVAARPSLSQALEASRRGEVWPPP